MKAIFKSILKDPEQKILIFIPIIVQIPRPSLVANDNWIIGNLKHAGFYRVNYDSQNWNLLINQLKTNHTLIDSTSRAQLIDDSFNLGRADEIDQLDFFRLSEYLTKETDPLVFSAVFSCYDYVNEMLATDYLATDLFKVGKFFCF